MSTEESISALCETARWPTPFAACADTETLMDTSSRLCLQTIPVLQLLILLNESLDSGRFWDFGIFGVCMCAYDFLPVQSDLDK